MTLEMSLLQVLADNGSIYCIPHNSDSLLKIDTIHGTVENLDINKLTGMHILHAIQ